MSENGTDSSPPTSAALELLRRGPEPRPETGRLRRLVRRLLFRILRPFSAYQESVDQRLIDAIDELDRRMGAIDELDRRLRRQERLQLDVLTEDLVSALDSLRSRVVGGEDVIAGSRAIPYMADGALEEFHDDKAGVVLGYRDRPGAAAASYRAFEDVFRGPEERVRERQRVFLDLLDGHGPVLDAGCGRGEFLDLMRERGLSYVGVDADEGMVARCRAKGHERVDLGTANDFLERVPEAGLGAIFSAQVIEHIPAAELLRFLRLSLRGLRPGGLFVAETVNPHAPHAMKTFWVDPTHQHPLFPEVALVLCRLAGFASAYVFHPLGTRHVEDDRYRESEYAVVATKA